MSSVCGHLRKLNLSLVFSKHLTTAMPSALTLKNPQIQLDQAQLPGRPPALYLPNVVWDSWRSSILAVSFKCAPTPRYITSAINFCRATDTVLSHLRKSVNITCTHTGTIVIHQSMNNALLLLSNFQVFWAILSFQNSVTDLYVPVSYVSFWEHTYSFRKAWERTTHQLVTCFSASCQPGYLYWTGYVELTGMTSIPNVKPQIPRSIFSNDVSKGLLLWSCLDIFSWVFSKVSADYKVNDR